MSMSKEASPKAQSNPARWTQGAHDLFRNGGHQLVLSVDGVTDRHEAGVRWGDAEIALLSDGQSPVLAYRIGEVFPLVVHETLLLAHTAAKRARSASPAARTTRGWGLFAAPNAP
jgi:hypothetical protein